MSRFHVWSTCQKWGVSPWHLLQELVWAASILAGESPGFSVTGLVDLLGGMGWNSWSGANVLSCVQGRSAMQHLTRFLRLSRKSCAYRKCRADCGSETEFFDLGCRTRAPIRRDRGKADYLESKRQESCEGVCHILHLTSVNTKDREKKNISI